jgi:hypothetical protein
MSVSRGRMYLCTEKGMQQRDSVTVRASADADSIAAHIGYRMDLFWTEG